MLTVKSDPVHLACVFGDYAEGILLLLFLFWVVEYFMHKGNHRIPKKEQAVGLFSFCCSPKGEVSAVELTSTNLE